MEQRHPARSFQAVLNRRRACLLSGAFRKSALRNAPADLKGRSIKNPQDTKPYTTDNEPHGRQGPRGRTRDYYVVIPAPAASGPLQGTAVAVYECFGLACTLYMRETKIPEVPASDGTAKTTVIETVPGLKPVTLPPGAPAPAEEDGLIEKNLD